jgi:predicted RNA-binding Zn-ribbon protein involved in translation (DUF1610 family)
VSREAAALAVAARTSDGARAALLDYLEEHSDDPELRDRAELVRMEGELVGLRAKGHGPECTAVSDYLNRTRGGGPGGQMVPSCSGCMELMFQEERIASLQSRLSAWPCPECGGTGLLRKAQFPPLMYRAVREAMVATPSITITEFPCTRCERTGVYRPSKDIPLTWDCGYPRWSTLPTMADAVREEVIGSSLVSQTLELRPTPRLRALASVPPWGVPLEGVRVGDRKPYSFNVRGVTYFRWHTAGDLTATSTVPRGVYDILKGGTVRRSRSGTWRFYPTESAAVDSLARALVTFAREYK